MNKKNTVAIVGLGLSVVLLWQLLRELDARALSDAIRDVNLGILSLSLVTRGLAFVCMGARTAIMLGEGVKVRVSTKSQLAGFAGNNLLPFRMGELIRIDMLSRATAVPRMQILGVASLERLLDLLVLAAVFATVAPIVLGGEAIGFNVLAAMAAGVFSLFLVTLGLKWRAEVRNVLVRVVKRVLPRWAVFIDLRTADFLDGLEVLKSSKTFLRALLLTFGYWTCSLFSIAVWISAFGLDLPWYAPAFILGFLAFGTALPSAPGFVGTWHYLCRSSLVILGVMEVQAVAFALVGHFMAVVPYTVLSLVLFGGDWVRKREVLDE